MSESLSSTNFRRAIFLSACINCLMALTGTLSNLAQSLNWLGWIARGIATPPGLMLRFVIHPTGHSVVSFALAAFEGLAGSFVFYTLVAWGALWLYARQRSPKAPQQDAA
jgi:hypothetical protein